ncbi:Lysosome membrane protein 2-like protein [Leptotrombidium deliense]|uniref:Lysosome membrane protein 2-like protein n=1 Tax=Leptotrombidium deliense TaxID=299467 RepID=A0A443SAY4_9ACAR|nr:Lysosome membrane protein 2-like protein [Leptotrombidium deliense]
MLNAYNQVPLVKGTDSFEKWENSPVPYYMKFYIFDLTNRQEYQNGGKANVTQRGPYVFKEVKQKKIANISNDGANIVYQEVKSYYFIEKLSNGTLDDQITFINIPAISAAKVVTQKSPMGADLLNGLFEKLDEKVVEKKTVKQILFDGYEVAFLKKLEAIAKKLKIPFDSPLPDNTFGLFYRKNCTMDTRNCLDNFVYGIDSGKFDVDNVAQYISLNGSSTLNFWNGTYCNMLNGTDGSRFHPSISASERLYMFNIDLCRSVYFDSVGEVDLKGINLLKFTPAKAFYKSPYGEPSNECFCVKPKAEEAQCQYDGILDISTCRKGAPIAITAPHFYKVDPRIAQLVNGLSPDQKLHETFVDIEPNTGLAMNAARRVQVNVQTQNYSDIAIFSNLNPSLVPFLWLEETATIDDKSADEFKSKVYSKVRLLSGLMIAAIVIGLLLVLIAFGVYAFYRRSMYSFTV